MLDHEEWMALATEEYRRIVALLRASDLTQWHRPTDCTEWDVFAMVSHLAGAADSTARLHEMLRQAAVGLRRYPRAVLIDSINDMQVVERVDRTPQQLLDELEDAGRRGVRRRTALPAWLRRIVVPIGEPVGTKPLGYLTDRIYTRDAWMHRIDLARALEHELVVTSEQDGRLVADLVDEWTVNHGRAFDLTLTGPAGLHRAVGTDGEVIVMDAIEFARTMSGRVPADGLLAVGVTF